MSEVVGLVSRGLVRTWCLDVDYAHDPGVHLGNAERTTGLQRNLVTGIAEAREQVEAIGLCEGFPARHTDMHGAVTRNLG